MSKTTRVPSDWLWEPPLTPGLPVRGERAMFPVNRIFCVARNYLAHAKEMNHRVDEHDTPFYFLKSSHALVMSGAEIPFPPATALLHHEIELVVALGGHGFQVSDSEAASLIYGYAAGLDLTRRDCQQRAKDRQMSWDVGKNFEYAAVCSEIVKKQGNAPINSGRINLTVNGELRQFGDLADLIWSVPALIADLSRYYYLAPGDLIYTGTPEGVGPLAVGDRVSGHVEGVADVVVHLVANEVASGVRLPEVGD